MPHSDKNVRFQVLLNGRVRKVIGLDTFGAMGLTLSWVRRDPKKLPAGARKIDNEVYLNLVGLETETGEFVVWLKRKLRVGDEITLRVLPPGQFDKPRRSRMLKST